MSHHIQEANEVVNKKEPTKVFEENSACVAQLKEGYIKSDRTNHITKKWTLNMYGHATIQLTCSQKLFRVQHSENTSTVLECNICVTCNEKTMSTILRRDYSSVLFFRCHGFCPN